MKAVCRLVMILTCASLVWGGTHLSGDDSENVLWGQIEEIKQVIAQWHAACGEEDVERLKQLYLPEKASKAVEDLAELRGLTEKIAEVKLAPAVILWNDAKAMVLTGQIEGIVAKRAWSMTWHLDRSPEGWRFVDRTDGSIVGALDDAAMELKYIRYEIFIDKFPTGHMWLNIRDPKGELVSNSRVGEAAAFRQARWNQLDDAPAEVREAAEVVREFIAGCMGQDNERVKKVFRPGAGRRVDEAIKEMNRRLAVFREWQFSPMVIQLGKRDSEVVSHSVVWPDYRDGGGDQGVVKIGILQVEGEWRVYSVSSGSLKGVPEHYGLFYRHNPNGIIWCDAAAPEWIKPELQPKVETFAKDIIERYVKNEPKKAPLDTFEDALYEPNVFESYFPDDEDGGKQLDAWAKGRYKRGGEWPVSDDEAVEVYRKGLRRSTVKYRGNSLMQSVGSYVWHTEPDNEAALELMYNASYNREFLYYSVYSGLSVAKPKPDKVLRRLAEIAMAYKQIGRICWGVKNSGQQEDFEAVLKLYLDDSDPEVRDRADIVLKALAGEIDARQWESQWSRKLASARTNALYGEELPVIKELLLNGNSFERRQLLDYVRRRNISAAFDESWREAMIRCLQDGNPFVREHAIQLGGRILCEPDQKNERILKLMDKLSTDVDHKVRDAVAVFVGGHWVWGAKPQVPEAIEIMQRLSRDVSREVRNNAIYYGLSVLERKDEDTIAFLVDLAMDPYRQADVGRIGWGLRGGADKEALRACLMPLVRLKNGRGERARQLYQDIFKEKPLQTLPAVQSHLQQLIDAAKPGATVTIPKGVQTEPILISKPLILKGESRTACIFEVTADRPAIFVDTKGKGKVTVEGVTIKWQLATSDRSQYSFAVAVKDTKAEVRDSCFLPLGNYKRCPVAIQSLGFSELAIDTCRFEGYEYTICFGEGTKGEIRNSLVIDSGHQGISLYAGATAKITRNIVTGSKYHAVRSTGGTLDMKDNLIIENANRGVYLGNKTAHGTIANNIITGNRIVGISGFGQSDVKIHNNLILDSDQVAIGAQPSCRFMVKDNIIKGSPSGIVVFLKEGAKRGNLIIRRNTFWNNEADTENLDKPTDAINADPRFVDPNGGDFSLKPGPALQNKQGLTDPNAFIALWQRWNNRTNKNEPSQ